MKKIISAIGIVLLEVGTPLAAIWTYNFWASVPIEYTIVNVFLMWVAVVIFLKGVKYSLEK